jgi:Fe-S cluster biogenesis protein NfuA
MTDTPVDAAFGERIGRIEALIQEVEQFTDPEARAHTRRLIQAILDLHGAGLGRILDHVASEAAPLLERLADDDLVGSLLLLYGLHPVDVETRVRRALDEVRAGVRAAGGDVELLDSVGGVVRIRLRAGGHGCRSTAQRLQAAVEEAVYARAPDLVKLKIEGLDEQPQATFVPVEQLTVFERRRTDEPGPAPAARACAGHEQG